MKKFFVLLLIIFFSCFALNCDAAQKKRPKKTKTKVEIETKDGFLLVGDLYFAPQKKPPCGLVVMLHSFGSRASDWSVLPEELRLKNYNVLALDLRGHGRSVYTINLKYKSRMNFKKEDWAKYPLDVATSIEYIKKNYPAIDTTEIYIIGADIGANSGILAANAMKNKPKKMVLVSPFVNFKDLNIALEIAKLDKTPMLIMASKADKLSFAQADIISRLVHSPMTLKLYDEGGSGTLLLKRNPSSYDEIVKYISDK